MRVLVLIAALAAGFVPGGLSGVSAASGSGVPADSALHRLGLDQTLVQATDIVLLSFNPNIGDNIILDYSLIQPLHQANPGARIHVVSPTSRVLQESDWLKPVALGLPSAESIHSADQAGQAFEALSRRTGDLLAAYSDRRPFYVYDEHSAALASAFFLNHSESFKGMSGDARSRFQASVVVGFRKAQNRAELMMDRSASGGLMLNILAPNDQTRWKNQLGGPMVMLKGMPSSGRSSPGLYGMMSAYRERLFGVEAPLTLPPEYIHAPDAESAAQLSGFRRASFADPARPYVVVNLNTKLRQKRVDGARHYAQVVSGLLDWLKARHGGVNVLITPPEPEYGPKIRAEVDSLVAREKGRVAYLPEGKVKLWNPLIQEAAAVVTQDSGFLHISNVLNPRVLSLSLSETIDGRDWALPGQKSVGFPARPEASRADSPEMKSVYDWLERALSPRGETMHDCLAKETK